jgi:hypothetical protein
MENVAVQITNPSPPIVAVASIDADDWRGYQFTLTLDAAARLSGVEVKRSGEALPLNQRRLRLVPLALLERAVQQEVGDLATGPIFSAEEMPQSPGQRQLGWSAEPRLAEIAKAYVETLGEPQQSQILAQQTGLKQSSIPKYIRLARNRHLLTATTKGSPGGFLTPKALALLDEGTPSKSSSKPDLDWWQGGGLNKAAVEVHTVLRELQAQLEEVRQGQHALGDLTERLREQFARELFKIEEHR